MVGQLISSIGSGLTDFGIAIYVLALTGSVTATALVSICAFLPSILLAPVGGVLADRYDRRLTWGNSSPASDSPSALSPC